jgi:hypothetical protein
MTVSYSEYYLSLSAKGTSLYHLDRFYYVELSFRCAPQETNNNACRWLSRAVQQTPSHCFFVGRDKKRSTLTSDSSVSDGDFACKLSQKVLELLLLYSYGTVALSRLKSLELPVREASTSVEWSRTIAAIKSSMKLLNAYYKNFVKEKRPRVHLWKDNHWPKHKSIVDWSIRMNVSSSIRSFPVRKSA